jgi:collagenase-like PrtC family protease
MKILSPVDKVEEVEKLIEAGADELYCGVLPKDWPYRTISINRRAERNASFQTFEELGACIKIAHSHGVPVFLTINEHYCTDFEYPIVLDYIERALDVQVDAFIVTDISLILTLRERHAEVHISTGGTTFNSECAKFYQSLGAKRIILSRQLTVDEISHIVTDVPEIMMEVFILNSKCPNIDGFCTFHHGLEEVVGEHEKKNYRNACMLPYEISVEGERERVVWERQHIWRIAHMDDRPCGVCAIMDFREIGVESLKIVGRGNTLLKKVVDIKFIKTAINLLKENPGKRELVEKTRKVYQETYGNPCRIYMCYYPYFN